MLGPPDVGVGKKQRIAGGDNGGRRGASGDGSYSRDKVPPELLTSRRRLSKGGGGDSGLGV